MQDATTTPTPAELLARKEALGLTYGDIGVMVEQNKGRVHRILNGRDVSAPLCRRIEAALDEHQAAINDEAPAL